VAELLLQARETHCVACNSVQKISRKKQKVSPFAISKEITRICLVKIIPSRPDCVQQPGAETLPPTNALMVYRCISPSQPLAQALNAAAEERLLWFHRDGLEAEHGPMHSCSRPVTRLLGAFKRDMCKEAFCRCRDED
jgi:hypothetical protein